MIVGHSSGYWAAVIFGGAAIIGVGSVLLGLWAPRWPDRWLARDRGPLRLLPGDSVRRYERLGALFYKRFFPEGGSWFGGAEQGRRTLPDLSDPAAVRRYVRETRRGEWVHWLSTLTWLPLPLFQPWPLALFFLAVTLIVNGIAIVILRYNRVRLYGVLDGLGASRFG